MAERERLILELDMGAEPIAGRLGPAGGPMRAFAGYVDLIAALEAARRAGPASSRAGSHRPRGIAEDTGGEARRKRWAGGLGRVRSRTLLAIGMAMALAASGLALPAGPAQAQDGLLQDCSVCVDFVTTTDPDGPGPLPPHTRVHQGIPANVPYALDVNGPLLPVPLGVLPALPGYEMRVNVQGLDPARPTVRIEKLVGAPAELPLRIEVLTGTIVRTSFGYDALGATAPESFVAGIDLSDRDGRPATDQAAVELSIAGAGRQLTIVNEEFTGDPVAGRANRHIRRLEFSGDGERGTRVPGSATIDLTTSGARQRVILTRDAPTTLGFELREPGGNPRTTGTIDVLPSRLDVTVADPDIDGDGDGDRKIDYRASAIVERAEVTTVAGPDTTTAVVEEVPAEVHFTHAATSEQTEITYHADGRARRARVDSDDGTRELTAEVENLPANIDQLKHTETADGGTLVYHSDASADRALVQTREGPAALDVEVQGVPADVDPLTYATPEGQVVIDHAASGEIPHAQVRFEDVLEEPPAIPAHRREISTTVDRFPSEVDLVLDTVAGTVDWTASAGNTRVHVLADDERPLFGRATHVDLLVDDIPPGLDAAVEQDQGELRRVEIDGRGDSVGEIELLATNGADQRMPRAFDGILLRNLTDAEYVVFGRVRGLRRALYRPGDEATHVELDARPPAGTVLAIDSERDVEDIVYTDPLFDEDGDLTGIGQTGRDGTEKIEAVVLEYPADIRFDLDTGGETLRVDYEAASAAGRMQFSRRTEYRGSPVTVGYRRQYTADRIATSYPVSDFNPVLTASLDPMPRSFHVCQMPEGDGCNEVAGEDIFGNGLFEDFNPDASANAGSTRFSASPRTRFIFDQRQTEAVEIAYLRDLQEVEDAGDECEQFIPSAPGSGEPHRCRYRDDKPGLKTAAVDLTLGELAIQAHLESSGWTGHNIASIFADGDNQGYVAMDTGWRDPDCVPFPAEGEDVDCDELIPSPLGHGHFPPGEAVTVNGPVEKGGFFCVPSESCQELEDSFPAGFAGKVDEVSLQYGEPFAAATRVFEFDPDELVFAEHHAGHVYCGEGTDLRVGSSGFTGHFCEPSLLPPGGD